MAPRPFTGPTSFLIVVCRVCVIRHRPSLYYLLRPRCSSMSKFSTKLGVVYQENERIHFSGRGCSCKSLRCKDEEQQTTWTKVGAWGVYVILPNIDHHCWQVTRCSVKYVLINELHSRIMSFHGNISPATSECQILESNYTIVRRTVRSAKSS